MNTYILKINYANLSKEVQSDYLNWVACFHRVLVACIVIIEYNGQAVLPNLHFENKTYDDMYKVTRVCHTLEDRLRVLGVMSEYEIGLCTDMLAMVEEFIQLKYVTTKQNFLSLSVDDDIRVVVKLTSIAQPRLPLRGNTWQ